ncbi:hypothetical protein HKD37_07G018932 [Glycine soja]
MDVFGTRDDVLQWARSVTHENGFIAVIMRSNTQTGSRGRSSFVLIGCERSGQYKCRKKEFVRRATGSRKCGCPFKLHDQSAYRSSIRGSDTEMQHLMKLLERDQYIHWHRLKDEEVVRDLFWCHPDAMKLCNACHLVFLIDNTYKTNRRDSLPVVIVNDRDLTLMNIVKTVFPECTNLLCRFHIDKNVKAKCKTLIGQKNAWEYVMDAWGSLFHECLQKFEMACSPWPMFIDYVNETWIIPYKEKVVTAWTNKVMHLGNTTTNSLGDLCSVWDAMNNMIILQHTEIKASFEISTHVVEHVFKKSLYKRLLGMVSRYALNQIATEFERVHYADKNPSSCGCVMRTTHGLPCACELSKYVLGSIPLDSIHMFWRKLIFSDQGLCEAQVTIKEEIETISKRFEELDVCGKVTLKSKLRDIAYPDQNSMCPSPSKVNTKGAPKKSMNRNQRSTKRGPNSSMKRAASSSNPPNPTRIILMLDQFEPFIQGFIDNIVDVKADDNCGYQSISALLGMGEDSWSLVRNQLIKELDKWSDDYINLFGGTKRFEELRWSLLVDGLSKAKQGPTPYISRMQQYKSFMMLKRDYVGLNED